MIKLRLSGSVHQLERMIKLLISSGVQIIDSTPKPIKDRNSSIHRMYITVSDIEEEQINE